MNSYRTEIMQDVGEHDAFLNVLEQEKIQSYLEIGSKYGGSLWRAALKMPKGSKVVAVDMPQGTKAWPESSKSLVACINELQSQGYDARVIWGSSQTKDIVRQVQKCGPFDCVMIDADHRLPGLTEDWKNYGPMSRKLVAFHDISWHRAPEWIGTRIDVPELWDSIKGQYRHQEFRYCPTGKNNGIGVLWVA